jgi:hypothetical protein
MGSLSARSRYTRSILEAVAKGFVEVMQLRARITHAQRPPVELLPSLIIPRQKNASLKFDYRSVMLIVSRLREALFMLG